MGIELYAALFGVSLYVAYNLGFRKGTATSATATMWIMREFLNEKQGADWTDITLGKNFNRVHRWMSEMEDGEEGQS
tara:strand:+ start:870 stop:1100 length:231 start_codon:yes stop_codon:yes gene_type:complete